MKRYFLTGLFVLLPAWGTFLILQTLFFTVDGLWSDLLGPAVKSDVPGLGIISLLGLIFLTGIIATDVVGQQLVRVTDDWVQRIPLVRSIYLTLKGMTDLFHFRSRFDRSTVVVFPFPREGLWALGFIMGAAPAAVRPPELGPLLMVFVPTAIHPFTGYLAFLPREKVTPINLAPEDALKMEFSAGLFRPQAGWLAQLGGPEASRR
ncbi:MAG: DUF502 domain-containing protein [Nitrospiraceae bacterium]